MNTNFTFPWKATNKRYGVKMASRVPARRIGYGLQQAGHHGGAHLPEEQAPAIEYLIVANKLHL